jgi:hypothetical protein
MNTRSNKTRKLRKGVIVAALVSCAAGAAPAVVLATAVHQPAATHAVSRSLADGTGGSGSQSDLNYVTAPQI